MFTFLMLAVFCWLFFKGLGLAFRLTWGAAKIAGSILMFLALPVLGLCAVFAGGLLLIVPLAMVGIAIAILKACL